VAIPYTSPVSVDFRGSLLEHAGPYYKYFLLVPLLITILGFFVGPLIWLFRVSLYVSRGASGFGIGGADGEGGGYCIEGTWTLNNYIRIFTDGYFLSVLGFTIELALIISIVAMLIAYPFAYYIYKSGPRLKAALLVLVLLPKLSNMLVLVYGLEIVLSNNGLVNNALAALHLVSEPVKLVYTLFSVIVGEVLLIVPYTVLVITATLHGLDPTLREAAKGMGASPAKAFWLVTFPLSLPGASMALLITVVWGLGAFVSPALLGNPNTETMALEVPKQTFEDVNWAMGSAIAFAILALMTVFVLIYNWALSSHMAWRS
jgi:ABC-type spermidine/putrescine transport system permease subunit I